MTDQEHATLETMIDKHGLASVPYTLSHICREKADHKCGNAVTC